MDHNEIEACVVRAKNGSKADTLMLLEQFKPFIFKSVGNLKLRGYDTNDLVQIGYASIMNALKKYKVGSNTFSCYAIRSIANAFKRTARQNKRYETELALNTDIRHDESPAIEFIDLLRAPDNLEEDAINTISIQELKKSLSKLKPEEVEFLTEIYFNELTLKDYSKKAGLSYTSVLRKNKHVLDKLKRKLLN